MGYNYKDYLQFDETWKNDPHYDCIVKFLLRPNQDLLDFHRRTHKCRIEVNRIVYKLAKAGKLPKIYDELLKIPEIIALMEKYGFILNNHRCGIAYSCYDPYKAYAQRNTRITKRPSNLKEWGSLRFKKTDSIIKDLSPKESSGKLRIVIEGKGKTKRETEVNYKIPKGMMPSKQYIGLRAGGNIQPPSNKQDKKTWVFGARAKKYFKWSYQPDGALGFDIGKRPEAFISFSDGDIWERTTDVHETINTIRELNVLISNRDKTGTNSKTRKRHRIAWDKAQKKLKKQLRPYVNNIIDKLDGRLLCVDNLTSGASNGEFGQIIKNLLITELHRLKLPYILVPTPHTSQRCSACGYTDKKNRPKQDDKFLCIKCNYKAHADINAAINIMVFGQYIWDFGITQFWAEKKDGMIQKYLFVDQTGGADAEYSSGKTTLKLCSPF